MKKLTALTAVLLAVTILCCEAYVPQMIRGRPKGGFLGVLGNKYRKVHAISSQTPQEQWYVQKLDHFNGADTRYWKQRYFTNDTFYKPGKPLFVFIGGEGAVDPSWMFKLAWTDYAKKYNAYCVILEHRFYGKSHPTPDMSVENLQFLSSEQALADLAVFISDLRQTMNFQKVIVFGGSYAGSLSAWFRLKYPHLGDGAVASSAPVLAVVNFKEYLEVVNDVINIADPSGACNDAISTATDMIRDSLATLEGRRKIKNLFRLRGDIDPNIKADISNLYSTFANNFEYFVQNRGDTIIKKFCGIMTNSSYGDLLQRYAEVNTLSMKYLDQKYQDFKYDQMIQSMREISWSSSTAKYGDRQWTYQTCTEFAFYQSSDASDQPFGHDFPIDFWTHQCADIFGPNFNIKAISAAVKRSNVDYGGQGIKVSRVLFPNGSLDPWHVLGILKDTGPDALAIFINGTSHCADMDSATPYDLPQIAKAKAKISDTIGHWLQS